MNMAICGMQFETKAKTISVILCTTVQALALSQLNGYSVFSQMNRVSL